jgi:hypothetical protein
MSTELANLHALSDTFLRAASEMQSQALGTLLKFSKGKYFIGDDEVTGQERIAHVPAAVYGFVKFWDGKPVAQRIGRIADGFQLPDRDDLGDNDKKEWQRDSTGKEKDPWSKQYYVPMEDIDSGEITTFVTGSDGGEKALGKLFDAFARNVRNGQNGLPVIKLLSGSYRHREFGRIETPDFQVVSWDGGTVIAPPPASGNPPPAAAKDDPISTGRPRKNSDMDDDIPFAPEFR